MANEKSNEIVFLLFARFQMYQDIFLQFKSSAFNHALVISIPVKLFKLHKQRAKNYLITS